MPTPVTFADVLAPATYDDVKLELLTELTDPALPVFSWESGSYPSSLIEVQAAAETDYLGAQIVITEGGLNSTAEGDALTVQSHEVFDNDRFLGTNTVGYVRLTDVGNGGPYTFQATTLLLQAGANSNLRFTGLYAAVTGLVSTTLPRGGSVDVVVKAQDVGVEYSQIGTGTLSFFVSGRIPGVTSQNPSDWLTKYASAVQGTNDEADEALRLRNLGRWDDGVGSPERVYKDWAVAATENNAAAADRVTRCTVYTGSDIFDPGLINVTIASSVGAVGSGVVTQVQQYIAPAEVGGSRIPETARAVVASAVANNIAVTATLFVQSTYNTAAFQAQVAANLAAYFSDVPIGGLVSAERVVEVLLYPAGVGAGVITDAMMVAPLVDISLAYNEVSVATPVTLTFTSV